LGQLLAPAVALRNAQLWLRSVTNAELAELFDRYRKSSPGTALQKIANEQFRSYAIRDPKVAPFAHPYYWAAFALYGN
jgi:CHAT domain-containing protein